jgi:hypothetical protein
MSNEIGSRVRYGVAFWRAHHEAWQQSALNQREYCETQGIPLKAFGNWRARFKAEPQPPVRKLLCRRRGLSHTLSHSVGHMTYGCAEPIAGNPIGGIFDPVGSGRRSWRQWRPVSKTTHFPGGSVALAGLGEGWRNFSATFVLSS